MDDKDIAIKVYRGFINENRYTVYATYINDPFKSGGEAYVEDGLIAKLFGVSFDDQLKTATCEAIKNLKLDYKNKKERVDFMNSLDEKVKLYAKNCNASDNDG